MDQASLEDTYLRMRDAYTRIFTRLGLRFRVVDADSGEIGGSRSQEFHVLADSGEDAIAYCDAEQFASNVELAPARAPRTPRPAASAALTQVATPRSRSIEEVSAQLGVAADQCLKILLVSGSDGGAVALALRGDHELNAVKAERLPEVARPLTLASPEQVLAATGAPPGFAGPVGLKVTLIADHAALALADFVCGANREGHHYTGANWIRDAAEPRAADLRNVVDGDEAPAGGVLSIARGIEVGHIFQLGQKYSAAMKAVVLDQEGRERTMTMGCYGIGVSRIVAAAIEQNHDEHGIMWPEPMSPYAALLVVLNPKNSPDVTAAAEKLYHDLGAAGLDVLLDDRDARPGVKFAEADLLGIPHRLVIGERSLRDGVVEYRARRTGGEEKVPLGGVVDFLHSRDGRAA